MRPLPSLRGRPHQPFHCYYLNTIVCKVCYRLTCSQFNEISIIPRSPSRKSGPSNLADHPLPPSWTCRQRSVTSSQGLCTTSVSPGGRSSCGWASREEIFAGREKTDERTYKLALNTRPVFTQTRDYGIKPTVFNCSSELSLRAKFTASS